METPDGQEFSQETQSKPVTAAAQAVFAATMMLLRAIGKIIITIWRLAAALDSALWRATKLFGRHVLAWLDYVARLAMAAFRGFMRWLPTRTGRAYSSLFGAFLVICALWMIDLLRAGPSYEGADQAVLRPPLDEDDPILARIEGRYVHLSEIEAAAVASGFLQPGERLTPQTAYERNLVESYVEQRLLAKAALEGGMQRNPGVSRRVNAARDRVLASAYMDAQIQSVVTPQAVERLYERQSDVTRLGDEVRARHIVVETEEEAVEIVELLGGDSEFSVLARERSLDRATAPLGGEVGWFTRAMMTPAFSKAAFGTEPGNLAPVFQSEFGWHVLEVLDRRASESVPLSQVQRSIEEFLRMRTIDRSLRTLEEESQVVYFRPEEQPEWTSAPPDLREIEQSSEADVDDDAGAVDFDGVAKADDGEPESMR